MKYPGWTEVFAGKNKENFEFFRYMITFRQQHSVIRGNTAPCSCGFTSMNLHCIKGLGQQLCMGYQVLGVMFSGIDSTGRDDIVYLRDQYPLLEASADRDCLRCLLQNTGFPLSITGRGDMSVITEEDSG